MLKLIFALAMVGLLANVLLPSLGPGDKAAQPTSSSAASAAPVRDTSRDSKVVAGNVILTAKNWEWGGFDSIMLANFDIKNTNAFAVKDLEIECTHYANSGTKIDSNTRTLFDVFAPDKVVKVRKFNMGFVHSQAASSSCSVTSATIVG